MMNTRALFLKMAPVRDKRAMLSSNFEKLANIQMMKKHGLARANLQLFFQKVCGGQKTIELLDFVDLMRNLHKHMGEKEGSLNEFILAITE